jgi:hypothetical protein
MYSICLRAHDQSITERTSTPDRATALLAFGALLDHGEFDGTGMRAILNHQQIALAHHRFDCVPGDDDYWRGRVDQLEQAMPLNHRPNADGGHHLSIYLDAPAMARAVHLGHGDPVEGVRRALRLPLHCGPIDESGQVLDFKKAKSGVEQVAVETPLPPMALSWASSIELFPPFDRARLA